MAQRVGLINRWAALRTYFGLNARGFSVPSEPRSIGDAQIGQQLMAGQYLFGGELIKDPDKSIWDVQPLTRSFASQCHGFDWLDHLVAQGGAAARNKAQDWVAQWISRYGGGWGAGWTPQLTGRRAIRLLNHSDYILQNAPDQMRQKLLHTLSHHSRFLALRAKTERFGLPQIEAMAGWVYCALLLEKTIPRTTPATAGFWHACTHTIGSDGAIASRNPEELLEIFATISWVCDVMRAQNINPPNDVQDMQEDIAPVLRSLRLGDGGMTHMQNGGRGAHGRLDRSLRYANVKLAPHKDMAMGYARMAHAGAIALLDAGPQKTGAVHQRSLLSLEFSNLRQAIIVNVGPGSIFGKSWAQATNDEPGQSALCVNDAPMRAPAGHDSQITPILTRTTNSDGCDQIFATHDGYLSEFGLHYERQLTLLRGATQLHGRDRVIAKSDADKMRFDRWLVQYHKRSIPLLLRFHLMPGIGTNLSQNRTAVVLNCPDGQVWQLRIKDHRPKLRNSAYIQVGRLAPIATKQVLVNAKAVDYEAVIDWVLEQRPAQK